MTFETLPVVHLDEGALPEYPGQDPERVLTGLARRYGRVVLVDVAGVRANDADLEFIQHAGRKRSLWVDAGSRYATDAMDLFVAGAETVTMRWNTLDTADELKEASELCQPGTLFVALEYPRGEFLAHRKDKRSPEDVAQLAAGLGVGLVFILDRADDATLRALPHAGTPRFVHGPADAALLQSMGFQGGFVAAAAIPEATE